MPSSTSMEMPPLPSQTQALEMKIMVSDVKVAMGSMRRAFHAAVHARQLSLAVSHAFGDEADTLKDIIASFDKMCAAAQSS